WARLRARALPSTHSFRDASSRRPASASFAPRPLTVPLDPHTQLNMTESTDTPAAAAPEKTPTENGTTETPPEETPEKATEEKEKETPPPKEMRAVVLTGFGGLKTVKILKKPEPTLAEGEVLIRVKACDLYPLTQCLGCTVISIPTGGSRLPRLGCFINICRAAVLHGLCARLKILHAHLHSLPAKDAPLSGFTL
ncbi:jg18118, partial [Pararge aegeria aegeria]